MTAASLDHLVWAVADLDVGVAALEHRLGVRAAAGGRHPGWGTHNALVGLGAGRYLEVVAPDPRRPDPTTLPALFGLDATPHGPGRLATWAFRTADPEGAAARAADLGVPLGEVMEGSRRRPDGSLLSWRLSDPSAPRLDGVVPFAIDWRDTPHPSAELEPGCTLAALGLRHPRPERVGDLLEALGLAGSEQDLALEVREGPPGMWAELATPRGAVRL